VRCGICGSENAESNYFCGMCGAALVERARTPVKPPQAPPATRPEASKAGQAPVTQRQETVLPQPQPAAAQSTRNQGTPSLRTPAAQPPEPIARPAIRGPSFPGLNTPPTGRGEPPPDSVRQHSPNQVSPNQASRHQDQLQHSSRSLDYLLEDEEEPHRGWGKLLLLVVALLLAAGFGYLHWKQGGFDWVITGDKKPAAATDATAGPGSSADSPSTSGTAADAASTPAAAPSANPQPAPAPGADSSTPPAGATDNPTAPAATQSSTPQTNSPQAAVPQTAPDQTTSPSPTSSPSGGSADSNPAAASSSGSQPAADPDAKAQSLQAEPPVGKPREHRPTPAKPLDPVTEGERYVYGRGAAQDCERGMKLLKPAGEQSNPKAMISLGTLYSTGTCAPRDLPTAYHWFALALHKEPDNQSLQDDLQKLWGQMTQPERQLAIKLSQ